MKILIKFIGIIVLIINCLSVNAQSKQKTFIETEDGNIYVGVVIEETDKFVKMLIGGRDIISIQQSNVKVKISYTNNRKRHHTIALGASNYYGYRFLGLDYDLNIYKKNNLLLGGTVSGSFESWKVGAYAGFRQRWKDILKVELGMGSYDYGYFSGVYTELAYRSQRENRLLFWEVNTGFLVNIYNKRTKIFGYPYGGVAVGLYF